MNARARAASKAQTVNQLENLIPAVAYLRMSDQDQAGSIEQQRQEVAIFAQLHGYRIIREYVDSGLSGSKNTDKRTGFLQMIRDSHQREFKAILCWDSARFGRLDSLKAAPYKQTLRDNGVYLHTVKDGVERWDTMEGRIMGEFRSEMSNAYALSLSKDSIRGRLDLLNSGQWPNGKVPYAYDRLYRSQDGKEILVARHDTFRKPEGWRRELKVNDKEAKIVRWIFDEFVNKDNSMRFIARQITAPTPSGAKGHWTQDTVHSILANKAYAGYAHIGGLGGKQPNEHNHNHFGYHEKAGCHEAIVSLETWEKAQAKLARNREEGTKVQPGKASPVSGVLFCGHCGFALDKHKKTRHGKEEVYFTCSSQAKRPNVRCPQWRIKEEEIFPVLIKHLVEEVDRSILEANQATEGESIKDDDGTNLQAKLAALVAKIGTLDDQMSNPDASASTKNRWLAKIKEWEQEQEILERQIANLTITEGDVTRFAAWWNEIRANLVGVIPVALTFKTEQGDITRTIDEIVETPETRIEAYRFAKESLEGKPQETMKIDENGVLNETNGMTIVFPKIEVSNPGVVMESSRFRNLVKSLGVKVKIFWEREMVIDKKTGELRPSLRNFDPVRAEVSIGGKNFIEGFTSTTRQQPTS